MASIPNDYTACEVYQGYTIAIGSGSLYSAFDPNGKRVQLGCRDTRAKVRRDIDRLYDRSRVYRDELPAA